MALSSFLTVASSRVNYKAECASFLLCRRRLLPHSSTVLSERHPPGDLLLAACQSADHCICLSAEYQLINAFTVTINKTAERLLSLIERYSEGCIEPNEKDTYSRLEGHVKSLGYMCVCECVLGAALLSDNHDIVAPV